VEDAGTKDSGPTIMPLYGAAPVKT
jgi:hypothetical protein